MHWFRRCLCGSGTDVAPEHSGAPPQHALDVDDEARQGLGTDLSQRCGRLREIEANIATVCAGLSNLKISTWLERIYASLGVVEAAMGVEASLVIFGPVRSGAGWYLSGSSQLSLHAGNWMNSLQERLLMQKAGDSMAIIHPIGPATGPGLPLMCSVFLRPIPGVLAPTDYLALPIHSRMNWISAALLLRWSGGLHATSAISTTGTAVAAGAVKARGPVPVAPENSDAACQHGDLRAPLSCSRKFQATPPVSVASGTVVAPRTLPSISMEPLRPSFSPPPLSPLTTPLPLRAQQHNSSPLRPTQFPPNVHHHHRHYFNFCRDSNPHANKATSSERESELPADGPMQIGAAELSDLDRITQILSYGIFADTSQAMFLAQVAEQVYSLQACCSLHDLVCSVLEAVPALLYNKLQLSVQPLLAASIAPFSVTTPAAVSASASVPAAAASSSSTGGVSGPVVVFSWRQPRDAGLLSGAAPVSVMSHRPHHLDSSAFQPFVFTGGLNSAAAVGASGLYGGGSQTGITGSCGGRSPYGSALGAAPPLQQHVDSGVQSRLCRASSVASLRMMPGPGGGAVDQDSCHGGGVGLTDRGGGANGSAGVSAAVAAAEASRIKAVRLSLHRTLLLKAIRSHIVSGFGATRNLLATTPNAADIGQAIHSPLNLPASPQGNQLPEAALYGDLSTDAARGVCSSPGGGNPIRRAALSTLVLSDASMHVLGDQSGYRDILLAGTLLGGVSPGSVILCTEAVPTYPHNSIATQPVISCGPGGGGGGTSATTSAVALTDSAAHMTSITTTAVGRSQLQDIEDCIYASHNSNCKATVTAFVSSSGGGGGGINGGGSCTATAAAPSNSGAAATAAAPPPVHLAMYLVSEDSLPVGVLNTVASELQPILALIFSTFRSILAASSAVARISTAGGRISADWQSLYEQLTGKPKGAGCGEASSGTIAAVAATAGILAGSAAGGVQLDAVPGHSGLRTVSEDGCKMACGSQLANAGPVSSGGGGWASRRPFGMIRSSGGAAMSAAAMPAAAMPAAAAIAAARASGGSQERGMGRLLSNCKSLKQLAALPRRMGSLALLASPRTASSGSVVIGAGGGCIPAAVAAAMASAGGGNAAVAAQSPLLAPSPGDAVGAPLYDAAPLDLMPDIAASDNPGAGGMPICSQMESQRVSSSWIIQSFPEMLLEDAVPARAPGPSGSTTTAASALGLGISSDVLVNTIRSRLTAAITLHQNSNQARATISQDLAGVELLEVLGRGGQGVVFRGTLHGLEAAIKVLVQKRTQQQQQQDEAANKKVATSPQEPGGARGAGNGPGGGSGGDGDDGGGGDGGGVKGHKEGEADDDLGGSREVPDPVARLAKRGAMEVAVASTLSHPNIVQVYGAFNDVVVVRCHYKDQRIPLLRLCTADDSLLAGSDPGPINQILCLEYCDAGTLLAVARAGAFRLSCATGEGNGAIWPALVPLYTSLLEVALALRHLHSRGLVHCDVKAANVLLKSSGRDPRGWSCKLSDFGCVRLMSETGSDGRLGFRMHNPLGTIGYMAPECFVKGMLLGPEVDIYAFGVLMWELLMCKTPYSNMNAQEVPRKVLRANLRPVFHPLAPAPYCALATRCWSGSLRRRPTAVDLVSHLQQLLADAQTDLRRISPQKLQHQQPQQPQQ